MTLIDVGRRLAYRSGVTTAIVAPVARGLISGLTAAFSTGSAHKLQKGAVVQDATALHVIVSFNSPISVSTQIATLRRLLLGGGSGDLGTQFERVAAVRSIGVIIVWSDSHPGFFNRAKFRLLLTSTMLTSWPR